MHLTFNIGIKHRGGQTYVTPFGVRSEKAPPPCSRPIDAYEFNNLVNNYILFCFAIVSFCQNFMSVSVQKELNVAPFINLRLGH